MRIQRWTPAFYSVLVAAHAGTMLLPFPRRMTWSYAFVLAVLGVTALLCARRAMLAVTHNRPLWLLLLGGLLAKGTAFILLFADSLVHHEGTLVMADPTFWFCLSSLFFVSAAAYDPATPLLRWASVADVAVGTLAAGLFYLSTRQMLASDATPPERLMLFFDVLDLFVVIFVGIRLLGTRRADERRFYAVLTAFMIIDAGAASVHNRFVLASESYLPEVLLSAPTAMLGIMLARRRTVWMRGFRPSAAQRRLSVSLRPLALSIAASLAAFAFTQAQPVLALYAMATVLLVFTMRGTLIAWYQLTIEGQLRSLRRGLQHAALHDPLTGLLNRRGLFRWLSREYEPARHARGLCIALIDIDHFKLYNDRYGHLAGDRCLEQVARALAREGDGMPACVVGRYGGEEFLMLLPHVSAIEARRFMDVVRATIGALPQDFDGQPTHPVTLSVGIASTQGRDWPTLDRLLRDADVALYEAKALGRNRVVVHEAIRVA
ncbi:GGDEF domain-containing protein [Luteibacter sp. PPL552]